MAIRNIVRIDEEKCNGCGKCISSCAEGALKIVNGKAKLIRDDYCDGLGACLGSCPQDAIIIEQREADEFDEKAVEEYLANKDETAQQAEKPFVCPSMRIMNLGTAYKPTAQTEKAGTSSQKTELTNWPIQLNLIPPTAGFLENADLLLAADCVAFAAGGFHGALLKGKKLAIACPKLDNKEQYIEKLAEIFKASKIKTLTVAHMEVPCCSGLTWVVQQAIEQANCELTFTDITISLQGEVLKEVVLPQ